MGANTNKSALQIQAGDMSANLVSVLPSTAKMPYGGQTLTPTAIVSQIDSKLADITAAANAKLAYATAVATKKTSVEELQQLVTAVVAFVKVMIPGDMAGQASCGIQPRKKKAKQTLEERTASVALGKKTRAAKNPIVAKVAKATTVVLGTDGQPLDGSTLPSTTPVANGAAVSGSAAPVAAPVSK